MLSTEVTTWQILKTLCKNSKLPIGNAKDRNIFSLLALWVQDEILQDILKRTNQFAQDPFWDREVAPVNEDWFPWASYKFTKQDMLSEDLGRQECDCFLWQQWQCICIPLKTDSPVYGVHHWHSIHAMLVSDHWLKLMKIVASKSWRAHLLVWVGPV